MEKMSCIRRVLLFVLSLVVFVMLPVYSAKAETHYILTEDGALVEDTHAERTQVVPHVMGINVGALGAAPSSVEWYDGWTTGVRFDREANKYYKLELYCNGTRETTVTIPSVPTSDKCFVPVGIRFDSKSYGMFTATVYEADSSGNIISGGTSTAEEYVYVKPQKKVGTPSNLVWNGSVLSWSASSDMTGVQYLVYKKDSSSSTGNAYIGEETVENINNTLDLSDFFAKHGEGEYKVHLYGITNMNKRLKSTMAISDFVEYPNSPIGPIDPVDPTVAHTITVLDDGNGKALSFQQSAVKGAKVTIYVNAINTGYEFDKWIVESGGITLDDPTSLMQEFTMQSENVVIKATFKLKSAATYGVTVTNDGNGTGTTDKNSAATGETVKITATPSSGYKFKEWQVVSGGVTLEGTTSNPTTFKMGSSAVEVKAVFEKITYGVTVTNDGNGTGTTDKNSAAAGETVTITATPSSGYKFKEWQVVSGGVTLEGTTSNPTTFKMGSSAVEVKAVFEKEQVVPTKYGVTVTNDGHGTGTPDKSSAAAGETVTITATPSSGYKFKEWQVVSGGVTLTKSTSNPTTFKMGSSAVEVKAVFEKITYGVTVTNDGNGTGTTDKNSAAAGETVTITATPSSGYKFKEWQVVSGGVTLTKSTSNPTTFKMGSSAVEVKAVFEKEQVVPTKYGVTVTNDGHGTGTPDKSSAAAGETVTITATPSSGYKFKEWQVVSGGVTLANATANPTTFKMGSSVVEVKAVFEKEQVVPTKYGVTVTNDGHGAGTTDKNSAATGETVTITATPSSGYKFKEWQVISGGVTLAGTAANPTTFKMGSKAVEVKAVFEKEQVVPTTYGVTVSNDGHGTGKTDKNSAATGETVTITATPSNGYKFKEWQVVSGGVTLAGTTANPTTFKMGSSAVEVKAVFEKEQVVPTTYGVTVTNDGHGTGTADKKSAATGETVTITATPSSGYKFKEWQVVSGGVTLAGTTANPTTFKMGSKAVEVKAVFEKEQVTPAAYTIKVTTDGHGTAEADKTSVENSWDAVKLTATPYAGYKFKKWVVISGETSFWGSQESAQVTIGGHSGPIEIMATFELDSSEPVPTTYGVTISNDGHGTGTPDKKSAATGETVKITATPSSGYKFKEWQVVSGGVTLEGTTANPTTFKMGSKAVEVKAVFEKEQVVPTKYGVTISNDGHGTGTPDKNSAATGETVTITATPSSGYKFKEWQVVSGGVTLEGTTANPTTFKMGSSAVEVKAVFEKAGGQADEGQIKAFVERLYNNILGRPGDEAGVANWVKLLVEGTQNGASVSFGFVFSDEFENRGLSNEAKVEILYNTFLNRTADDAGKKMWTDALDAGVGIEKIFEGFVMSDEFAGICSSYGIEQGTMNDIPGMMDRLNLYRNRNLQITEFVARCYTKALGRERDIDGIEMWCRLIINKEWTPRNVAADGFFHSDEFVNKNTTNPEYVAILYRTFLGRELDNDGYELWVGLLNRNEWTRDQVLDGFADSEEFGKILAGFGLN